MEQHSNQSFVSDGDFVAPTDFSDLSPRVARCDVASLTRGAQQLPGAMAKMGFTELRKGQSEPIMAIMGLRDVLCILPTATGKTAVFVLPTLAQNWKTIVFSPLKALMKDQVDGLCRKGVAAAQISSDQTDAENRNSLNRWMTGKLSLLYVAPERLRNQMFMDAIRTMPMDFVVMDEAHCLSQWSDNFRSDYCHVGRFIHEFSPKVVAVFTATCPPEVEADIRRVLAIPQAIKHVYFPRRRNLDLRSDELRSPFDVAGMCKEVQGTTLVYCSSIKRVEETAQMISKYLGPGDNVGIYHGELSDADRRTNQDLFMNNHTRVMVATNAFGMGIDKPDIRCVLHRDHPGSLEALSQEVGRAGRDGLNSLCITYASAEARRTQEFFIEAGYPPRNKVEKLFRELQKAADSSNKVQLTASEMAEMSEMSSQHVSSILHILLGSRVVDRTKQLTKLSKIKFKGHTDDKRFQEYREAILAGGTRLEPRPGEVGDAFVEVDLNWLSARLGKAMSTVRSYINRWAKDGLIDHIPPFAGKDTTIIGTLDLVDFERLRVKGQQAYKKLDQVLEYLALPDNEKHSFLEAYFLGPDYQP